MQFFVGYRGVITSVGMPIVLGALSYAVKGKGPFNLDPKGLPNAFEPFLAKYLKLAELIIGLASASIVLLVGFSAFHAQNGKFPSLYASPLYLLAASVVYSIFFSVWLTFTTRIINTATRIPELHMR